MTATASEASDGGEGKGRGRGPRTHRIGRLRSTKGGNPGMGSGDWAKCYPPVPARWEGGEEQGLARPRPPRHSLLLPSLSAMMGTVFRSAGDKTLPTLRLIPALRVFTSGIVPPTVLSALRTLAPNRPTPLYCFLTPFSPLGNSPHSNCARWFAPTPTNHRAAAAALCQSRVPDGGGGRS